MSAHGYGCECVYGCDREDLTLYCFESAHENEIQNNLQFHGCDCAKMQKIRMSAITDH